MKRSLPGRRLLVIIWMIGGFLLALNLYGLGRNPGVHGLQLRRLSRYEDDVRLTYEQVRDELNRRPRETAGEFVHRVCDITSGVMAHFWAWESEDRDRLHIRLPVWENWALAVLRPSGHELLDSDQALRRGFGLCSQHCLALADILQRNDIDVRLVDLASHMMITAKVDERHWWVLDPDFGAVIPYDVETVRRSPGLAIEPFRRAEEAGRSPSAATIYDMFGGDHPIRLLTVREYCGWWAYVVDRASASLKWLLPCLCLLPWNLLTIFVRRKVPSISWRIVWTGRPAGNPIRSSVRIHREAE